MSKNREKIYLTQEFFVAEYISDEGKYVKTKYTKVEQWAFYLRFISAWFTPCKKDQLKLKKLLLEAQLRVSTDTANIGFNQMLNKKEDALIYSFTLPFVHALPFYEFIPCVECQKVIAQTLQDSSVLTIGNKDYNHPVELSRKNQDEDDFLTVIEHEATDEEKRRVGDDWRKDHITKEEWEKLPVID